MNRQRGGVGGLLLGMILGVLLVCQNTKGTLEEETKNMEKKLNEQMNKIP